MVSGLILAGGTGRRMGAFKPTLILGGRPLILRTMAALRPLTEEVVVAHGPDAHRDRLESLVPEARLVGDEGKGPLGGLFEGSRAARGDWILVAPADTPFLSPDLYGRLIEEAQPSEGCIPSGGTKTNPLIGAYRRGALLRASEAMLRQGERAAQSILPHLRLGRLSEDDLRGMPFGRECTFDIDTQEDLARAKEILASRGDLESQSRAGRAKSLSQGYR